MMKVHIAILTTRDDEFTAVRERFQTEHQRMPSGWPYLKGVITTHNQHCYTIAIARSISQGNGASQRLAHHVIQDLDPGLLVLVGIAGGIPHNEFTLGDVIVSTHIVNPDIDAKNVDGTTHYMVGGGPPHPLVEQIISLLPGDPQLDSWNKFPSLQLERPNVDLQQVIISGNEEWRQRVQESLAQHFGQESNRQRHPLFKTGPIISTNHLMRDPDVLMDLLRTHRSVLAVEMEAAGVYEAARRLNHIYPVMVIRGISDIVGLQRDDKWTSYACQTAAAFAHTLIKASLIDLWGASE
jgi:nucleoside phosphorylase